MRIKSPKKVYNLKRPQDKVNTPLTGKLECVDFILTKIKNVVKLSVLVKMRDKYE